MVNIMQQIYEGIDAPEMPAQDLTPAFVSKTGVKYVKRPEHYKDHPPAAVGFLASRENLGDGFTMHGELPVGMHWKKAKNGMESLKGAAKKIGAMKGFQQEGQAAGLRSALVDLNINLIDDLSDEEYSDMSDDDMDDDECGAIDWEMPEGTADEETPDLFGGNQEKTEDWNKSMRQMFTMMESKTRKMVFMHIWKYFTS